MITIDRRTRCSGDLVAVGPGRLRDVLHDTGALGARGVEVLELSTLGLEVDGATAHLVRADGPDRRNRNCS